MLTISHAPAQQAALFATRMQCRLLNSFRIREPELSTSSTMTANIATIQPSSKFENASRTDCISRSTTRIRRILRMRSELRSSCLSRSLRTATNRLDYQRADFDTTHVFNFNGIYQLPFGQGKRFLSYGGFADKILGGWEISGLASGSRVLR